MHKADRLGIHILQLAHLLLHLAAIIARVHEYAKDEERNRERHHAEQPHPPVDSKGQDKGDQQKGDGDAATWLPSHKPFRCQYIARQIAIKRKYHLWVTTGEKAAMQRVLATCSGQGVPG